MKEIIIPSSLYMMKGYKVLPDIRADISKLFQNSDDKYTLTISNKRRWICVMANLLDELGVKGNFTINVPYSKSIEFNTFNYALYPKEKYYTIPCKELTVKCNGRMNITQPANKKINKLHNSSPLETLNLYATGYNIRIHGFKKLEKIIFNYDKNHLKNLNKNDWYNNFLILRDCTVLKELDLSQLTQLGSCLYIDFENVPDDCNIKINTELLKQIEAFNVHKNKKKRLNIACYRKSIISSYGDETTAIKDVLEEYKNLTGIVEIKFSKLKEIINKQIQKHSKVISDEEAEQIQTNPNEIRFR